MSSGPCRVDDISLPLRSLKHVLVLRLLVLFLLFHLECEQIIDREHGCLSDFSKQQLQWPSDVRQTNKVCISFSLHQETLFERGKSLRSALLLVRWTLPRFPLTSAG